MRQLPEIFTAKKRINNGSDEVAISVVCLFESLTKVVEHVDLILKGVKPFISGSGIEQKSRNLLEDIIVGDNLRSLKEHAYAHINDVEVNEFLKDLFIVPNVQKNLKDHIKAIKVFVVDYFRNQVDELFIESSVSKQNCSPIRVFAYKQKQLHYMPH